MGKWLGRTRTGWVACVVALSLMVSWSPLLARAATDAAAGGVPLMSSPPPQQSERKAPDGRFGPPEDASRRAHVSEVPSQRAAKRQAWANADGTLDVTEYTEPRFFQAEGSTDWQPIDSAVEPDPGRPGWLRSKANRWSVGFSPEGNGAGAEAWSLDGGAFSFVPVGANSSTTRSSATSSVTYHGLWRQTDAVYDVAATEVDERLILHSGDAPSSFAFDLVGATARGRADGGADVLIDGAAVSTIPPLTVDTATHAAPSTAVMTKAPPSTSSAAKLA